MPRIAVNGINSEDPWIFNRHVLDFLTAVDSGMWGEFRTNASKGGHR